MSEKQQKEKQEIERRREQQRKDALLKNRHTRDKAMGRLR